MSISKSSSIATWVLQLIAAGILGQTLFFKFFGAPESIFIFSTLGVEPWGRIGAGLAELAAAIMLLTRRTAVYGAMLSVIIMLGAIGAHLTRLGIQVAGDGGLLFTLACIVLVASAAVVARRRGEIGLCLPGLPRRTRMAFSRD